MVDLVWFQGAVFYHQRHFFLMVRMHRRRANVEFMYKFPGVLDHETDGFSRCDRNVFWLAIVIEHLDFDRAGYLARFANLADALQIIANSRELLPDDYMDVLRSMFDAIPQLEEEIRNARADGDAKSVESAAHRMKTNSATLGAMELSDWAQKVETAAKEGTQEVIPDYLAEIEKEYRRVVPAINKLLS